MVAERHPMPEWGDPGGATCTCMRAPASGVAADRAPTVGDIGVPGRGWPPQELVARRLEDRRDAPPHRLEVGDLDHQVDDRLAREARHRRGADVLDPADKPAGQQPAQPRRLGLEPPGRGGIVGRDLDRLGRRRRRIVTAAHGALLSIWWMRS